MLTDATLAHRLERVAKQTPDKFALRCDDDALTYRELEERVARAARGFKDLGVHPGDPVCVLLETSSDYVVTWIALCRLGAIEVPINTGFRGTALAHALRLTGARLLVLDAEHLEVVRDVQDALPALRQVLLRGDQRLAHRLSNVVVTPFAQLFGARDSSQPVLSALDDTALLVFTSGSTGPSKACAIPHGYTLRQPELFCEQLRIGADDVLYAPFPLFHVDGAIFTFAAALASGGTAALARKFSASRFWSDCRRHEATIFDFMGATLTFLFKQPPGSNDRDHSVRLGWGVPLPPFAEAFEQRFGLDLVEVYGLSDAGIVLYNQPGQPRRAGSCGRPIAAFELRIRDEQGRDLGAGAIGELAVRPTEPHLLMSGYYGDPAATTEVFRDGWFQTGDLMRRDEDGFHYFVSRKKDIIRRRGENISAFDLEQTLLAHPEIVEAAAYGVPSELTDEDVMVSVVLRPGSTLRAEDVVDWCAPCLSRHMWPRYVRLAPSLPRTPTEKIAKYQLKALGVTPDAVDLETYGRRRAANALKGDQ